MKIKNFPGIKYGQILQFLGMCAAAQYKHTENNQAMYQSSKH